MKASGRNAQRSVCTSGELLRFGRQRHARQGSQTDRRRTWSRCRGWLASAQCRPSPISSSSPPGKVREIYEWEDDLLMVASDRISTYDVVMPTPIPDKGKVLNRMSVFWFGLTGDIVPNHFISEDVPEEVAERAMRVRQAGDVPGRVRRPRLPLRLGLEGIPRGRRRLRDRAAGRPARVRPAAGADLHPGDQGRDRRPRRERRLRPRRRDRRRPGADGGAAAGLDRGLRARRRARGRARDHPRRHQVRVRPPRRRRDRPRRRGADPGLLALLARRPATSRARRRPPSTSSSSATGPTQSGWDKKPPAPELPPDVVEQTRAKYVEAYERITERSF